MKSVVFALYFLTSAVSNAIALALAPVSVDPFVIYNYGRLVISRLAPMLTWSAVGCAGASLIGGILFYWIFRDFDKAEDKINGTLAVTPSHSNTVTRYDYSYRSIGRSKIRCMISPKVNFL
jgi:hypothetical protein